ncbi:secretin N-terminal domain-containing protein [Rugamonas sp. DEMB1]|uniref:secretin N-terminal domain-containing protein n=1 Tax=Rugamonas sp. DEMB1 TaxID=3039386 RepID=UPI002448D95A|nr:secretin N-terminal domain-containing protein [Rugamonas sp. DEMB1]WGG52672.1 secretin N-terminal domain-containing protein [Rugamonas sp. DEMB1]
MNKLATPWLPVACCALLTACAAPPMASSPAHINEAPRPAGSIPDTVQRSSALPAPKAAAKVETYSVTVHKVPVQSLLFALARDAGLNVDIHPGIEGMVTLNALDQTMPQLLKRIAQQVDMRYEIDGNNLLVLPDAPVWRNYKVDYVNIARSTSSSVNIATQISTTGGGSNNNSSTGSGNNPGSANSANTGSGNNNSTTSVNNRSDNNFWYTLEKNIRDMLRPTNLNDNQVDPLAQFRDQPAAPAQQGQAPGQQPGQQQSQGQQPGQQQFPGQQPGGYNQYPQAQGQYEPNQQNQASPQNLQGQQGKQAVKPANSVVVNIEGGLIAVRATGRQHEKIQEFLDIVLGAAKRQVLIEATIIEVRLGDQYQQGINWQRLGNGGLGNGGLTMTQRQVGSNALPSGVQPDTSPGLFVLNYANPTSRLGNIAATIQLLESFGKVKVLSSPKISVLNNQTALLKVVDNNIFFTIKVTPAVRSGDGNTITTPATYESRLETVPVGFVMSVTPQIAENDEVTLNVRPTITRIVGYVQDPNPALADAKVVSKVPVIQARELESIMKVASGQVAVMGGLMQDSIDNSKDGVPGLSGLPVVGNLFAYRNENNTKTELVIFMRPVVVKDASLNGDYKDFRYLLPDQKPLNSRPYGEAQPAAAPAPAPLPPAGGDAP